MKEGVFCLCCLYNIMKKQQVKNLEDEFSSLFRPQNNRNTISSSESIGTDQQSQPQSMKTISIKQPQQGESQNQSDFLDQVDNILDQGQESEQVTRREIMLNFKLNSLKLLCKNLKMANTKLAERIEELERPQSSIMENTVELNRSQDLTMMQQQFTEIEEELARYKQQLAHYQQQMASQLAVKNEEISEIRRELSDQRTAKEYLQRQLREKNKVINLLQRRNEDLLLAIQELENSQQEMKISRHQGRGDSFNDKISQKMETMIDKLLNQLKYEKKTSAKHLAEIKRLNSEIILLESKIKERNNKVYELQLALIKAKRQPNNANKEKSPQRYEYEKQQAFAGYIPQQNYKNYGLDPNKNKSQASLRALNKNRVSAEREEETTKPVASYNQPLPINKIYSTFTLMDLLNKQFKIRLIEKYVIVCRAIQLYAGKLQRGDYSNLIPEQVEIYNFSSHSPSQLKVKFNSLNRMEGYEAGEESMLYNMAFILDTLLNQVQVLDSYLGNPLELNFPNYIQSVLSKQTREEKHRMLLQLSRSIQREYTDM